MKVFCEMLYIDAKAITVDYTMVNLFMLLRHDGIRPKQRNRAGDNVSLRLIN
jgi:hypothetical protein